MLITVKDFTELTPKKGGKVIRFSLTFHDEAGTAAMTTKGWRVTDTWKILPPTTTTRFGKQMTFVELSESFKDQLVTAISKVKSVVKILGKPEDARKTPEMPERRLEGEGQEEI